MTMGAAVTLYIDYRSPFSYLAKDEAYELEQDFAVEVVWRPYHTDLVNAMGGPVEDRSARAQRKVRYLYMDVRRLAARRGGLVIRGMSKICDPTVAHVGLLHAQDQGVFRRYHDAVSARFWRRELDIEDAAAIAAVLEEAGADASGFPALLAGDGPARLAAITAEADAAGVFGVPTFVFAGELFWGADRIWLLRERLAAAAAAEG